MSLSCSSIRICNRSWRKWRSLWTNISIVTFWKRARKHWNIYAPKAVPFTPDAILPGRISLITPWMPIGWQSTIGVIWFWAKRSRMTRKRSLSLVVWRRCRSCFRVTIWIRGVSSNHCLWIWAIACEPTEQSPCPPRYVLILDTRKFVNGVHTQNVNCLNRPAIFISLSGIGLLQWVLLLCHYMGPTLPHQQRWATGAGRNIGDSTTESIQIYERLHRSCATKQSDRHSGSSIQIDLRSFDHILRPIGSDQSGLSETTLRLQCRSASCIEWFCATARVCHTRRRFVSWT